MLRLLVLIGLLAVPAHAAQVTPSFGLDDSGSLRKLYMRDPTLPGFVPLGVLDTPSHTFVTPTVPVEFYGAKGDSNGTTGNGTDDTATIQACVAGVRACALRAGATYRVTSRITLASGSSLVCAPGGTIYADPASFNLTNISGASDYASNAVVLYASGGQATPFTPLGKITVRGCKIVGGAGDFTTDGRWMQAIGLLNVAEIDISNNEIVGLPIGYGIHVGSIGAGSISGNWIHDFYEDNPNAPFTNIGSRWQMTAIGVDSDRINNITSDGLRIINNRCENMVIGPTAEPFRGPQSDCINVNSFNGKGMQVIGNYLKNAGEGFDNYSDGAVFSGNYIEDAKDWGIKVINGASGGVYSNNVVKGAGRAAIVLAPGQDPATGGGGNTDNNLFSNNQLSDIDPYGTKAVVTATACIRIDDGVVTPTWKNNYNTFLGNRCWPGPNGEYSIVRTSSGVGNVYYGNDMEPGTLGASVNTNETDSIYATTQLAASGPEVQVASADVTPIFAETRSNFIQITGTTNITSFGPGVAGEWRIVHFSNALTVTHNATSLILPGGTHDVKGGDMAFILSRGGSNSTVVFGQSGDGTTRLVVSTVAALPSCAGSAGEGVLRAVSDANSTTYNAVAAGGGSNHMPVYCNGTAWVLH